MTQVHDSSILLKDKYSFDWGTDTSFHNRDALKVWRTGYLF